MWIKNLNNGDRVVNYITSSASSCSLTGALKSIEAKALIDGLNLPFYARTFQCNMF